MTTTTSTAEASDAQQETLRQFAEDSAYFEAHRDELLQEHPDAWVAVFRKQVVGVAADLDVLLTDLRKKGVPVERAVVDRVTSQQETLILSSL